MWHISLVYYWIGDIILQDVDRCKEEKRKWFIYFISFRESESGSTIFCTCNENWQWDWPVHVGVQSLIKECNPDASRFREDLSNHRSVPKLVHNGPLVDSKIDEVVGLKRFWAWRPGFEPSTDWLRDKDAIHYTNDNELTSVVKMKKSSLMAAATMLACRSGSGKICDRSEPSRSTIWKNWL